MNRREFIAKSAVTAALGVSLSAKHTLCAQAPADVHMEMAPLKLEIAPGKHVETIAYNGQVPGPLIRWPEGKPIAVDVLNRTSTPEIVHWHGLWIPSDRDGAMEEGSPMIEPGAQQRYHFAPRPSGLRWYHTHTTAGHDLKRGLYTGSSAASTSSRRTNPAPTIRKSFLPYTTGMRTWVRLRTPRWMRPMTPRLSTIECSGTELQSR
jgi:FtsP/CotA-like multicopper oxidase with cupredoxin domain